MIPKGRRRHRTRRVSFRVFACPVCGQKMTAPKAQSRTTGKGHIKHMYCPTCKEVREFVQESASTLVIR